MTLLFQGSPAGDFQALFVVVCFLRCLVQAVQYFFKADLPISIYIALRGRALRVKIYQHLKTDNDVLEINQAIAINVTRPGNSEGKRS